MSGEMDLRTLLNSMRPELNPGQYVFTHVAADVPAGAPLAVTVAEMDASAHAAIDVPASAPPAMTAAETAAAAHATIHIPAGVQPVVTVAEPEGLTLVVRREEADAAGLGYDYIAGWITLRVHSALAAVGLTAAVAHELAAAGISCNVVAGFHHDHLFVPEDRAAEAVALLETLAQRS